MPRASLASLNSEAIGVLRCVHVDGFIAREDGSFDFFPHQGEHFEDLVSNFPETFPAHVHHFFGATREQQRFDTVLMGRATYEVGVRVGITNPYVPLRQFVVSKSSSVSPDPAVELHTVNPLELCRVLKREDGKDIWLCGGAKLAGSLLPEIDELILKIDPIVLGTGIPLFQRSGPAIPATLTDHKRYPERLHAGPIWASALTHQRAVSPSSRPTGPAF